MVFILKGKGEYRGIGLVEVLWKVCSVVVTFRPKRFMGSEKGETWGWGR